jgi:hypothetical protein
MMIDPKTGMDRLRQNIQHHMCCTVAPVLALYFLLYEMPGLKLLPTDND